MADHVSFVYARALPRRRAAVIRHFQKWDREQRRLATGFLGSDIAVARDNPDEVMGVVRFDTSRHYYANARRPAQDQWHRELVALLAAPPEWWDGSLATSSRGQRPRA
jgi:quinol monooxygenase YgiN